MERLSNVLRQTGDAKDEAIANGIDSFRTLRGRDIPISTLLDLEVPNPRPASEIGYTRRRGKIPLYAEVARSVFESIRTKKYRDKLPTEDALMKQYKVSKGTIRTAMTLLEQEGLIVKRLGSGTFVNKDIVIDDVITIYPQERKSLASERIALPPSRHNQ